MNVDKNICVYYHINDLTKEVFYVGIGNTLRPYVKSHRSKSWHEYISINNYHVIIVSSNLAWEEAVKLEKDLINKVGRKDLGLGTLLNKTNGGEGYQGKNIWLEDELKVEALKYETRGEFYKKSRGAYKAAIRHGILNDICSHMNYNRSSFKLTKDKCLEIALNFKKKTDLMSSKKSVYNTILKRGWEDYCFSHMKQKADKEYCRTISIQFNKRSDLMRYNKYIYNLILKNKWSDELFSHMTSKK